MPEPDAGASIDAVLDPSGRLVYLIQGDAPQIEVRGIPAGDRLLTMHLPEPATQIAYASGRIYLLSSGGERLLHLPAQGLGEVKDVSLPGRASEFVILPGSRRAVLLFEDDLAVIDLRTGRETARRSFEHLLGGLAVTPAVHVYVGGGDDLFVLSVLDHSLQTVRSLDLGFVGALRFSGGAVVGTSWFSESVLWVDPSTLVHRKVSSMTGASDAVYDDALERLYVLDASGGAVLSFSVVDGRLLGYHLLELSSRLLFDETDRRLYRVGVDGSVREIATDAMGPDSRLVPAPVRMASEREGVRMVVDVPVLRSGEPAIAAVTVRNTTRDAIEMFLAMREFEIEFWRDGRRAYPWGVQSGLPAGSSSTLNAGGKVRLQPSIPTDVLPGHYEMRIALAASFEMPCGTVSLPDVRSDVVVGGDPTERKHPTGATTTAENGISSG